MKTREAFGYVILSIGASAIGLGIADPHFVPIVCGLVLSACGLYFVFTRDA